MEELSLWVISDEEAKDIELRKLWLIHERRTHSFLALGGQRSVVVELSSNVQCKTLFCSKQFA